MDAASSTEYSALSYNPLRYRGYIYDTETGFYYLQSRYYDPTIRRFINADGYVSTGTGMLGYNMIAYCNNNPVNGCDPCGTCYHRWDFWNTCSKCMVKMNRIKQRAGDLLHKFYVSGIKVKEFIADTSSDLIDSLADFAEPAVSSVLDFSSDLANSLIDFAEPAISSLSNRDETLKQLTVLSYMVDVAMENSNAWILWLIHGLLVAYTIAE